VPAGDDEVSGSFFFSAKGWAKSSSVSFQGIFAIRVLVGASEGAALEAPSSDSLRVTCDVQAMCFWVLLS
jgi:hypothetical protein